MSLSKIFLDTYMLMFHIWELLSEIPRIKIYKVVNEQEIHLK